MKNQNLTIAIEVNQSPSEVFKAIQNVKGWWSEQVKGSSEKLNDVFDYNYKDVHICKMKLTEVITNKKIVWHVLENYFNFTKDKSEWKGNDIVFEIFDEGVRTTLLFTQIGLTSDYECYDICSDAWGNYIRNSLKNLIETGRGNPNPYENAIRSADEKIKN
jgi:hypothetical protein